MATENKVRALIHGTDTLRRGVASPLRVTLAHPMENGLRADGYGNLVPRSLCTRFECRLDGALVFAADLNPGHRRQPHPGVLAEGRRPRLPQLRVDR